MLAGLISGCGSSVAFNAPTIPDPLLEQIPISVGLRMAENFEHFVHEEKIYASEDWTIDLGRGDTPDEQQPAVKTSHGGIVSDPWRFGSNS